MAKDDIEAERAKPGSQERHPSGEGEGHNFFLWGQSVYIISQLLGERQRKTDPSKLICRGKGVGCCGAEEGNFDGSFIVYIYNNNNNNINSVSGVQQ